MENDEDAFTTDTYLAANQTTRSRSSQSNHFAHHNQRNSTGKGAKESHNDRYEEAPLLSRDIDGDSDTLISDFDSSGDTTPTWSGAKDFEGRPWWNRPSVRLNAVDNNYTSIDNALAVLATPAILPLHARLRWHHCPQTQPYTRPDLQRCSG